MRGMRASAPTTHAVGATIAPSAIDEPSKVQLSSEFIISLRTTSSRKFPDAQVPVSDMDDAGLSTRAAGESQS